MSDNPPPYDIDTDWSESPLTRTEAFMLLSKMQRLIRAQSMFFLALMQKDKAEAQKHSDEMTALTNELNPLLGGLVVMPNSKV